MKFTPYPAHGRIVILAEAEEGEVRDTHLNSDGLIASGHYFFTKGICKIKVKETGEVLQDRIPGWLNLNHLDSKAQTGGTLELTFPVDSEWLCIPHIHNRNGLPKVKEFITSENEKFVLPNGSNLFLVRGVYKVNEKIFTGPTQIRVRTGDVEVTSIVLEKSYALIFE